MLKKRILASSLASVMALSSVSVVAFADETATADFGEAVTRAELKEILAGIEKDINKGVYDEYGTKFSDLFTKAYEAAVLAVEEGDDEYVVASYQVLQSVLAKKQDVGVEELKALVSDLSGKYKKGNIINQELGDTYYTPATWSAFEVAYEAAEIACESDNKTEICDAYFTLEEADGALEDTKQVTKGQLTKAYQDYRNIIEQKFKYESWRRGTATESVNSGSEATTKPDFKNSLVTYGDLYGIIAGASNAKTLGGKYVVGTSAPTDDDTWIKFPNAQKTLEQAIDTAYEKFMGIKTASKTSDDEIVLAYNACQDAVRVYNGWKVDDVRRGSASSFDALIRANATTLWTLDIDKDGNADALQTSTKAAFFTTSESDVSFSIKDKKIYMEYAGTAADLIVYLDTNGKLQYDSASTGNFVNTTSANKTVTVPKNNGVVNGKLDVTNIMPEFNLKTIGTGSNTYGDYLDSKCKTGTNGVKFTDALNAKANIDAYVTAKVTDFSKNFNGTADGTPTDVLLTKEYNDIMSVTDKTNSAAAYSLAYRILEYALNDIIPAPAKKYTKADVKSYVAKANALLEEAQESATFADKATALADELAATAEWLAAAGKKNYVEYEAVTYTPVKNTTNITTGKNSTEVWTAINTAYTALETKLANYPYSYKEISDTIAAVADAIDEGVYGASTDTVAAALEQVAYDLVTLKIKDGADNNAYDEYTFGFIPFNRVHKSETASQKTLIADLAKLEAAVEEATKKPEVVLGDLDGDGKVLPADARAALELFLNDGYNAAADIDGDGKVLPADARAILEIFLKA